MRMNMIAHALLVPGPVVRDPPIPYPHSLSMPTRVHRLFFANPDKTPLTKDKRVESKVVVPKKSSADVMYDQVMKMIHGSGGSAGGGGGGKTSIQRDVTVRPSDLDWRG